MIPPEIAQFIWNIQPLLSLIAILLLTFDNARLRRQLSAYKSEARARRRTPLPGYGYGKDSE